MKNLKRVLSLGLASVMLLGMMVVGASAKDFTDAADITHSEAVQVLVALNVINGMEDGSYFAPKDNVTRGEMAKMIAIVKMGGTDVNTGVKTTPSFTDIDGHWAEPYIEYCADMGIISGRGDGTFDPNGNVTGLEVTKMVLTTLGYEAKAYHLEGATWAAQTDELARTADPKLYFDLDSSVVLNAPATRDNAAQIIWNGLQNETRTINPDKNTNTGEVTWSYDSTGKILLEERYDAFVETGIFNGNKNYGATSGDEGDIGVTISGSDVAAHNSTFNFPYDLSIDYIGEEVKVVWKNGTKSNVAGPDKHDTIYGVFVTGATRVINSQLSKIKDQKSDKSQLNIDGSKYETEDTVRVVTNFTGSGTSYRADNGSTSGDVNSDLTNRLKHNSGDKFKAVFNTTNNKIDTIYVTETYVAAVTSVSSTKLSLHGVANVLTIEDHDIEEGLQEDDIVLWTSRYGTSPTASNGDAVVTVVKAEKVSGTVEGYKDDESVTIDGKTYKVNYKNQTEDTSKNYIATGTTYAHTASQSGLLASHPDSVINNDIITSFDVSADKDTYIDEDVDLYLSNGYVVAAVQTSESANNYSVITEVKSTSSTSSVFSGLQLQVMGSDGTKEIISVSKDSPEDAVTDTSVGTRHPEDDAIKSNDYAVGDIVTYTFDDDDYAKVTVRGRASVGALTGYNDGAKTVNGTATTSDCVMYVQTEAGVTIDDGDLVTTGADPEWEAYDIRTLDKIGSVGSKLSTVAIVDGKVEAVFINLGGTPEGAADDTIYGIISAYNGRVADYYSYTVQANGESYEILSEDYKGSGTANLKKGVLVTFKRNATDKYKAGKVMRVTDGTTYYTNNTAHVVYVDEYSAKDNTLSVFTGKTGSSGNYTGTGSKTYALDKDCQIVYVDVDADKSEGTSSVSKFSAITGYQNAVIVMGKDGDDDVIKAVFVETSGEEDIL